MEASIVFETLWLCDTDIKRVLRKNRYVLKIIHRQGLGKKLRENVRSTLAWQYTHIMQQLGG